MIGVIIIFLTLANEFLDKPHLFKRPVKKLHMGIFLALLVTAGFSSYKEFSDDADQSKSYRKIDSLESASKIQIALIDTLRRESKVAQKEYEDSLVQFHLYNTNLLARYGLKVDSMNSRIVSFDKSVQKEIPPTLTIFEPLKFSKLGGENTLIYNISALGANAHLLGCQYSFINMVNHTYTGKPYISEGSTNYTTIVPVGEAMGRIIFIDRIKGETKITDTFVVAVEYVYKSKSNKMQTPLRKVYFVDYSTKWVGEAVNEDFTNVARYLKKHKVWVKFYDL